MRSARVVENDTSPAVGGKGCNQAADGLTASEALRVPAERSESRDPGAADREAREFGPGSRASLRSPGTRGETCDARQHDDGLLDFLARIDAPESLLRHPAIKAGPEDAAPRSGAAL